MRPQILIASGTPPPYSGPEVMTAHLLRSPLKDTYHLIHFNISKGRDVSTKGRFDWLNVAYGVLQSLQLFWLMLRHNPDAVYTNLGQNLAGFLRYACFIWVAALFRKPIVVRMMGNGFAYFYQSSNPVLRWFIRQTLKRIDCFIVRAESLKKQLDGLTPPDKLRAVYSGINTAEFERPHKRADNGEVRVLFVGYLTKAKGAFDLLQAVPEVIARHPNVKFQVMGPRLEVERSITFIDSPANNEAVLRQLLMQKEIAEHIELLGVQIGEGKISAFVNADIFVLPSYAEAFPTVVLEAMAAGLPVVATPVGALPEVFDKHSILFIEPGNVSQLAQAILWLVQNPGRRERMGSYNRQVVRRNFDLEAYARRVDNVLAELVR